MDMTPYLNEFNMTWYQEFIGVLHWETEIWQSRYLVRMFSNVPVTGITT